jgi:hypothetical protein
MEMKENLLDKYYKGESNLEEEEFLKAQFLSEKKDSSEKRMFDFFESQSQTPDNIESSIFENLKKKENHKKVIKMQWFKLSSAAAIVFIVLSIFLSERNNKLKKLESDFFTMEQALYQVSQSIQPEEQEEMMVLWVDNNVEIIIN